MTPEKSAGQEANSGQRSAGVAVNAILPWYRDHAVVLCRVICTNQTTDLRVARSPFVLSQFVQPTIAVLQTTGVAGALQLTCIAVVLNLV